MHFLLFYASDTPFSIASARLCGHVWRMHRLLHPMDRPTCGWWPRHIQRPALCGDGVAAAAASLVGSGRREPLLCSLLAAVRSGNRAGARQRTRRWCTRTLRACQRRAPSTVACAPRDASRFSAEPVGPRTGTVGVTDDNPTCILSGGPNIM